MIQQLIYRLAKKKSSSTWNKFKEEYLTGKSGIYTFAEDLNADSNNHYPIAWRNKIYDSNESLGAERIAYEVTHQLAKIDFDKVVTEGNKIVEKGKDTTSKKATAKEKADAQEAKDYLAWIATHRVALNGHLDNVKRQAKTMTTADYGQQDYDKDGKKVGNPWAFEYREFSDKTRDFNFDELEKFVSFLTNPTDRDDGIFDFINKTMAKTWEDDQKWHIWTARLLTEDERKEWVKDKKVPPYYQKKDMVIYWSDEKAGGNGRNNITLKGLGGWIELYRAIFNSKANREKFKASQDYIQKFAQMYQGLIYKGTDFDSNIDLASNSLVKKFKDDYGITIQEVYDENGDAFYLPLTYDVEDTKRQLRAQKTKLTALEKGLGENDMANQGKLENEQNALIYAKQDELEKLDVKINDLMTKDEVKEKVQKLNELKKTLINPANATAANKVNWGREGVIIAAAKAEKLLFDIAWLQNDGIDGTKKLKEDENAGMKKEDVTKNLELIYEIEQQRNQMGDAWDVVIRAEFEKGGKDKKARIDKALKEESNGGIGLEAIRDTLKRLNRGDDSEVADEITQRLKYVIIASDSKDLTTTDLNSALGISDSTQDMVDAWNKLVNGWGKNKANIEKLFSEYSDSAKKSALITYIKDKLDSVNNDIKAASSDEDKFTTFKKQSPEFIIEHLVRHENSKALEDVKSTEAKAIITRMEAVSGGVDTNTYGDPKKPETIDSDKLYTFLYDEKLDNITKSTSQDGKGKREGNAIINHIKDHWGWYLGGVSVFIIGAIAIFWKSISEWWNGPAEEGSESEKNQDEDNE